MFDTTKSLAPTHAASAFIAPTELQGLDIWAEAGRAIELAYREPAPISQPVRAAVAVALIVVAKLGLAGVLP
jgi:hypothetical protein